MGKALYRSYRSKSFDEVIGQRHITDTLKNSIQNNTFSHAYLLTGPRGVGKTSVARILAHAVNDVSYPSEEPYVDIIEIDAASNRRIDEIRELRERVIVAPSSLKYKVYIIDEVHMLTREAFNALLKTLEEPPEHAILILATTDVHKVPDTIVSRCIQFHFKSITAEEMQPHLQSIAKKEQIEIDKDAIKLIAQNSSGSFRDAIALLDQVRGLGKNISTRDVQRLLGLGSEDTINNILNAVSEGDIKRVLEMVGKAREAGASENRMGSQLAMKLREDVVNPASALNLSQKLRLIDEILVAGSRRDTWASLEIALLKVAADNTRDTSEPAPRPKRKAAPEEKLPAPSSSKAPKPEKSPQPTDKPSGITSNADIWEQVLDDLKEKNRGLYAVARMAQAEFLDSELILNFNFAFHHNQMKQAKNTQFLQGVVQQIEPSIVQITYKITSKPEDSKQDDATLKNINNIFGASEVLES